LSEDGWWQVQANGAIEKFTPQKSNSSPQSNSTGVLLKMSDAILSQAPLINMVLDSDLIGAYKRITSNRLFKLLNNGPLLKLRSFEESLIIETMNQLSLTIPTSPAFTSALKIDTTVSMDLDLDTSSAINPIDLSMDSDIPLPSDAILQPVHSSPFTTLSHPDRFMFKHQEIFRRSFERFPSPTPDNASALGRDTAIRLIQLRLQHLPRLANPNLRLPEGTLFGESDMPPSTWIPFAQKHGEFFFSYLVFSFLPFLHAVYLSLVMCRCGFFQTSGWGTPFQHQHLQTCFV
jgi:hypothetical protein